MEEKSRSSAPNDPPPSERPPLRGQASKSNTPQRPEFYVPLTRPWVSRILLGINLLVFVATFLFGLIVLGVWNGPQNLQVLYFFGAKWNPAILNGEIWRLFAAMFLHIGAVHLLFNMVALFILGPMVEGYFGHVRVLAIYLLSGLFSSVASYAFSPALAAGASGAIFGLLGAIIVYFFRYRENFGQQGRDTLKAMLVIVGLQFVMGITTSSIDNWGHLGGLLGGLFVAWGLLPRYRLPKQVRLGRQPLETVPRLLPQLGWVALCSAVLVLFFQIATFAGPPTL